MVEKNLKFLRRYYGDKQESLAPMLKVLQSYISEYENGKKKTIAVETLKKIADRYHVSIDDLVNKDLSLEYDHPYTIDLESGLTIGKNMFPILASNVAKTNSNFNRGYEILCTSLQLDRLDDFREKIWPLEHAITLFQKAWKESKTYVALSNSISIVLLIYVFYTQRGLKVGRELLPKGVLSSYNIQQSLLRDPRNPIKPNPYAEQQKSFFEKYDDFVYDNIKLLKSNAHYSELGDFYLAMCNFVAFADDVAETEYESYAQAGLYMLVQLYKLNNKYAEKLIESLPGIS